MSHKRLSLFGLFFRLKVDENQYKKVLEMIESGKSEGAKLESGGGRWGGSNKGYFVQPTVFSGVKDEMRIARYQINISR